MHTSPRTGLITKLVLHDNEGPEGVNSAAGLRDYLLRNGADGGGYQATFDDRNIVTVQPDFVVCYANGAINHESIDGCIVGYASQTAADWSDLFDAGYGEIPGAIENSAQWFAAKAKLYGIPATLLSPEQLHDPNARGLTTHGLLTAAGYSGTQGHTDPGANFPLEKWRLRIANIISPQIDWAALVKLEHWMTRLRIRPLVVGDVGPDVQIMNDFLKANRMLTKSGNRFGLKSVAAVRHYKRTHRRWKKNELNGRIAGYKFARCILGLPAAA